MTTTGEIIDALVRQEHGASDARTQQLYRQNLQVLVELARAEGRRETRAEDQDEWQHRGTVH
jgi:hypothetical protein